MLTVYKCSAKILYVVMIIKFFDCNEVVLSDEIPSRSQYTERIYVNRLNNFI